MTNHWRIFWALAVSVFLTPLDSSMASTVLPVITAALGTSLPTSQWVMLAYVLGQCCLLLPAGRLGDAWGFRRLYLAGIVVFLVGSGLCAVAPTIEFLIGARVVESVGGALINAMGAALITATFPLEERGRGLGVYSAVVYVAHTLGPGIGGVLAEAVGWRGVFTLSLPIGVAGFFLAFALVPPDRRPASRAAFDGPGAVLLAGMLLALLLVLSRGNTWGWRAGRTLALAGTAGALGLAFVVREARAPVPLLDLALFRDRLFAAATASAVLNYMGMYTITLLTPFYLIQVRGIPPSVAGSLLMTMPVAMALVAPWAGWLSDRLGSRPLASVGMAVLTASLLWLRTVDETTGAAGLVARLAGAGLGLGLFTSPNTSAIMAAVPPKDQGVAGGMVATARTLGTGLGVATAGAVFSARAATYRGLGWAEPAAGLVAYGDALMVVAGLTALGVVTSLLRGPSRQSARRARTEA